MGRNKERLRDVQHDTTKRKKLLIEEQPAQPVVHISQGDELKVACSVTEEDFLLFLYY